MALGYRGAHVYAQVGFGLRYVTLFVWCHGNHSEPFKIPQGISDGPRSASGSTQWMSVARSSYANIDSRTFKIGWNIALPGTKQWQCPRNVVYISPWPSSSLRICLNTPVFPCRETVFVSPKDWRSVESANLGFQTQNLFFFLNRVSCSPRWPLAPYTAKDDLKFLFLSLPPKMCLFKAKSVTDICEKKGRREGFGSLTFLPPTALPCTFGSDYNSF